MSTKVLSALFGSLIAISYSNPALAKFEYKETEVCARNPHELTQVPHLEAILDSFGGLEKVVGRFKLAGLVGDIANMKIAFSSSANGFTVQANQDPLKMVFLCYDENDPMILRIRVQQPLIPENGLILVKPVPNGAAGSSILVAAHGSKWKFMRFKRIANQSQNQ